MNFNIENLIIPREPLIARRIDVKLSELIFNESVTFLVYFYSCISTHDMNLIKMDVVTIDGDEYKAWNNDDNYIINLICEKLGVRMQNTTTSNNDNSYIFSTLSNEDLGIVEPA